MRIHPLHLVIGLLTLVIVVDACFIAVALTHKDQVVESYQTADR